MTTDGIRIYLRRKRQAHNGLLIIIFFSFWKFEDIFSRNNCCFVGYANKISLQLVKKGVYFICRVILSEVLTAPSESSRLYATQFLLVLLRARLPDFQKWGIELLVMQLYDQSKAVSLAAIAILGEATEEKVSSPRICKVFL